jgi:hypothetical protein
MLLLQVLEQIEDLRLDGDVQRRGGLVGDRKSGSPASVMAIITRCFWPPLMRNG